MTSPSTFTFLNSERNIAGPDCWNDTSADKLWLYNLHYFDDLNADTSRERKEWHECLIHKWIDENPVGKGIGWEPYPVSLRIVNWIKWHINGNRLSPVAQKSLAVQARFLKRRLEYHLLANHLVSNAKALIFAGLFFRGHEAETWLKKGLSILKKELREQILPDGGNFERSPMYHGSMIEDMLDLITVAHCYDHPGIDGKLIDEWKLTVQKMVAWLRTMCHGDGRIALFNDAAFGIAPEMDKLCLYADQCTITKTDKQGNEVTDLSDTGYIRVRKGKNLLIIDAGNIGPDYQPGHAHADSLSFELSQGSDRIVVDSGTSCYGTSPERQRQRGTAAHNTVCIDNSDSSEVWGGFRVARRAKMVERSISSTERQIIITAAHNGYKKLKGVGIHRRTWTVDENKIIIEDYISGTGVHHIEACYHFHPDMTAGKNENGTVTVFREGVRMITILCSPDLDTQIKNSTYHPEFGITIAAQLLVCSTDVNLPVHFLTTIET